VAGITRGIVGGNVGGRIFLDGEALRAVVSEESSVASKSGRGRCRSSQFRVSEDSG